MSRSAVADFPRFVQFHEEGPREGFQIEPRVYPLSERAALVNALSITGLKQIQVASFVNHKAVPQMADAAQLYAAIERRPGVRYTALWLNEKGFEQARAVPEVDIDGKIMFYTSDAFSLKNNNRTVRQMRDEQLRWLDLYKEYGYAVEKAYIMTAFGCNFQGEIPLAIVAESARWIVDTFRERKLPLPRIFLADTTGWANPEEVRRRFGAIREIVPTAKLGMHAHDTRGLGIANLHAALELGVDMFESSIGGLGGCPFAGHGDHRAAGNVCTEDGVFLCHELGLETGIDLDALIEAARLAERIIGRPLYGRVMHSGTLAKFRKPAANGAAPGQAHG